MAIFKCDGCENEVSAPEGTKVLFCAVCGRRMILKMDTPVTAVKTETVVGVNISALLERAFMALEDGDFSGADGFCEQVLNCDAKNAAAYLGKLMVSLKVRRKEELANCKNPFDKNPHYEKILRFADSKLIGELQGYVNIINERSTSKAKSAAKNAGNGAKSKVLKKVIIFAVIALIIIAIALVLTFKVFIPLSNYKKALSLAQEGKYIDAIEIFEKLGDYKDSEEQIAYIYGDAGFETISAGTLYTVGLKKDGSVVAVGWNEYGQCDVSDWSDIVSVSAGSYHTVGLKKDGSVVAVGYNDYGQCEVFDWSDIVSVSAGHLYTVGLKKDGTVVAAGNNEYGQCDVSGWRDIALVSAGVNHTIGLKKDGTVVATGRNDFGQCDVSGWRDIALVSAEEYLTVGLRKDGTVVEIANDLYVKYSASGWSDIVSISTGLGHTVGLKKDGTVVAVGWDTNGECDVSDWSDIIVPKKRN